MQKGPVLYYEADSLGRVERLSHAFLTRSGGVSPEPFSSLNFSIRQGDLQRHVDLNFQIISEHFDIPRFYVMSQIHSDRILVVRGKEEFHPQDQPQADAVITSECGIAVGVKTADCVPIFLADPVRRVIAAVHAGWRGTALRIAFKTVLKCLSEFGSRPDDLVAAIGPAIGPCCYEVDLPVFEAMPPEERAHAFKERGSNRWMLNLVELNRRQLIQAGLAEENISTARLCTCCRPDLFFSHRKAGRTGRNFNFILLR